MFNIKKHCTQRESSQKQACRYQQKKNKHIESICRQIHESAIISRSSKNFKKVETIAGFTISELIVAVSLIGILSSIAIPNYLKQVNRSRQNEAASTISQIQTTIATYADEFGLLPGSWADLNSVNAVMTDTGPSKKESFEAIKLAGGHYEVAISQSTNLFTITSTSTNAPNLNIIACINLTNGASAVSKGTHSDAAETPNCG